jgi:hypothetical protein
MAAEIAQDDTSFVPNFIKSVTESKILQPLSNTYFITHLSVQKYKVQQSKPYLGNYYNAKHV